MKKLPFTKINFVILFLNICLLFSLCWSKRQSNEENKDPIKIVFFAGGAKVGRFTSTVVKGALLAGKHLGCNVKIVWSQWNVEKMSKQFKDELEKRPDAICMMGHPGVERLTSLVKEARRKNIIVTLQNVDIPELRKLYVSSGFGYVGQNLIKSGQILAEGLIRKYGLQKGDRALVFQSYKAQSSTRGQRGKGAVQRLRQAGLIVHEVFTPYKYALDSRTTKARAYIRNILKSQKNLRAIINDGIINNEPIIDELKAMGIKPGQISYGLFDLTKSTINHLKSGYVGVVHDQQPLLQGYYSVLQAYMAKKYRFSGLYVDTGLGLVDSSMLSTLEPLFNSGLR